MIKISGTNINAPSGQGSIIRSVDISYYKTEQPAKQYKYHFAIGQYWSRGGMATYRVDKIYIVLNRRGTEMRATLKSVTTPQQLEVGLVTLINFWTQLDSILKLDIIETVDNRFEVIDS